MYITLFRKPSSLDTEKKETKKQFHCSLLINHFFPSLNHFGIFFPEPSPPSLFVGAC